MEHSLSPPMQNAAFQAAGLPYVYIAVRVPAGGLQPVLQALRLLGARGANVTVPLKEEAASLADWLSPEARAAGTVNTLVFEGDRVLGYTTDGAGFYRALTEVAQVNPAGCRTLLLGAGGAARAVAHTLATYGASRITVLNRTLARAEALCDQLRSAAQVRAEAHPWPARPDVWKELFRQSDLVVQATSLGLTGAGAELWRELPFEELPAGALVTDLVYGPGSTPFLAAAARAGCRILPGDWMLLYQGAEAFRLWTGVDPPLAAMRSALHRHLHEDEQAKDRRGRDREPTP